MFRTAQSITMSLKHTLTRLLEDEDKEEVEDEDEDKDIKCDKVSF